MNICCFAWKDNVALPHINQKGCYAELNYCPTCGSALRSSVKENIEKIKELAITIWKDGTWKLWHNRDAEIAMDDKNWLSHIKIIDLLK